MRSRVKTRLAAQQGGDDYGRQEADQEARARAEQGGGGGTASEHRQPGRAGGQIQHHRAACLTPAEHQTCQHHDEGLQRDRHRGARDRNLTSCRSEPHEDGEQHRLADGRSQHTAALGGGNSTFGHE